VSCYDIRGRPNFIFFFVVDAEKFFFIFRPKRYTYFWCILFFGRNMAVKITENSECFNSALTHQGPRSSVNFSQHVQPQSVLGTNVGGLWAVSGRHCNQTEADGLTFAICLLQAALLSSTLP